jgi:hypothetical protein
MRRPGSTRRGTAPGARRARRRLGALALALAASLAPAARPPEAPGDAAPGVRLVSRLLAERGRRPEHSIEIRYPQIVGPADAAQRRFNTEVAALARSRAAEFRRQLAPAPAGLPAAPSSLDVAYTVGVAGPRWVSVAFEADSYLSGAAHPSHESFTLTYDLRAGRRLEIADLFRPGAAFLETLARHCADALARQVTPPADRDWIARGAAPLPANYRRWVVTAEGLRILFDPYQVAPYVDGIQAVTVPRRVLEALAADQGPLAAPAAGRPAP